MSVIADPRLRLRTAPMSGPQIGAVAVTVALSALDGFDVLAVTLAAPGLVAAWKIDHAELGLVLSMGLIGMAIGSLFVAPIADVIGRRGLLLLCLVLMCLGMALSATAVGVVSLSVWRTVTGLGIGAMIPVINPLATEFANERRRDLAVSLMAVGYPVGGVLGAAAASILLRQFEWTVLFWLGAGLSIVLVPLVLVWLPEPPSFLLERRPPGALRRLNVLLVRFGQEPIDRLPEPVSRPSAVRSVLGKSGRANTARTTCLNLLYVIAVYYVLSWVPQLVADAGFTPAEAASVSLLVNVAGILGGLTYGWLAGFFGAKRTTVAIFACFATALVTFSHVPPDLGMLRLSGGVLGFFLFGGMCALHAVVSRSFDDGSRATGAGIVLGIGRAGSAIAPLLAGILFNAGVERGSVSLVMAAGVGAAAILLVGHRRLGGLVA